ncbi:hypothetical protein BGW41_005628 [Actinomortierella wolfii]|nr:hypothetical protein BGW41_005628 [Actinomortierella wolfii]
MLEINASTRIRFPPLPEEIETLESLRLFFQDPDNADSLLNRIPEPLPENGVMAKSMRRQKSVYLRRWTLSGSVLGSQGERKYAFLALWFLWNKFVNSSPEETENEDEESKGGGGGGDAGGGVAEEGEGGNSRSKFSWNVLAQELACRYPEFQGINPGNLRILLFRVTEKREELDELLGSTIIHHITPKLSGTSATTSTQARPSTASTSSTTQPCEHAEETSSQGEKDKPKATNTTNAASGAARQKDVKWCETRLSIWARDLYSHKHVQENLVQMRKSYSRYVWNKQEKKRDAQEKDASSDHTKGKASTTATAPVPEAHTSKSTMSEEPTSDRADIRVDQEEPRRNQQRQDYGAEGKVLSQNDSLLVSSKITSDNHMKDEQPTTASKSIEETTRVGGVVDSALSSSLPSMDTQLHLGKRRRIIEAEEDEDYDTEFCSDNSINGNNKGGNNDDNDIKQDVSDFCANAVNVLEKIRKNIAECRNDIIQLKVYQSSKMHSSSTPPSSPPPQNLPKDHQRQHNGQNHEDHLQDHRDPLQEMLGEGQEVPFDSLDQPDQDRTTRSDALGNQSVKETERSTEDEKSVKPGLEEDILHDQPNEHCTCQQQCVLHDKLQQPQKSHQFVMRSEIDQIVATAVSSAAANIEAKLLAISESKAGEMKEMQTKIVQQDEEILRLKEEVKCLRAQIKFQTHMRSALDSMATAMEIDERFVNAEVLTKTHSNRIGLLEANMRRLEELSMAQYTTEHSSRQRKLDPPSSLLENNKGDGNNGQPRLWPSQSTVSLATTKPDKLPNNTKDIPKLEVELLVTSRTAQEEVDDSEPVKTQATPKRMSKRLRSKVEI